MNIDKWPSTPVKLITSWAMSVIFFLTAMVVMLRNIEVNEAIFYTLAGALFGTDAVAAVQFIGKRKTAWSPPVTASEVVKPEASGQPAPVAVPPVPPTGAPGGTAPGGPKTSAEAEEEQAP